MSMHITLSSMLFVAGVLCMFCVFAAAVHDCVMRFVCVFNTVKDAYVESVESILSFIRTVHQINRHGLAYTRSAFEAARRAYGTMHELVYMR